MRALRMIVLGGALALASTAAWAFQEQQGGTAPAAPGKAPANAAPAANLGTIEAPAAKTGEGTEVRIPGLGRLGVLPKMDFGLELLYGAAETRRLELDRNNTEAGPGSDDLTIRGTLRRKF